MWEAPCRERLVFPLVHWPPELPPPLSLSSGKPWKPRQAFLQLDRVGSAGGTKGQKRKEPQCGPFGLLRFRALVRMTGDYSRGVPRQPWFTFPPFCWCPGISYIKQNEGRGVGGVNRPPIWPKACGKTGRAKSATPSSELGLSSPEHEVSQPLAWTFRYVSLV